MDFPCKRAQLIPVAGDSQRVVRVLVGLFFDKRHDLVLDRGPADKVPAVHLAAAALGEGAEGREGVVGVELQVGVAAGAAEDGDDFLGAVVAEHPSVDVGLGVVDLLPDGDGRGDVAHVGVGRLRDGGHLNQTVVEVFGDALRRGRQGLPGGRRQRESEFCRELLHVGR